MTSKTHITGGLALSLALSLDLASIIILCVGSILPDIDHENSIVGKLFPIIPKFFKHRGILHSIWIPLILVFVNRPLCLGYLLHLMMDIITVKGVKIFYPFNFKLHGFIRIGGLKEGFIFLITFILALYFLVVNYLVYM